MTYAVLTLILLVAVYLCHLWGVKHTCQHCECIDGSVQRRRQNTAYVQDELNFAVLCDECQVMFDRNWEAMWDEYYAGLLP